MRLAVISDVHSNLAALEAVAQDIRQEAPDAVVCLGDLVGYNAEPGETLALLRSMTRLIVVGNHDRDATRGGAGPGTHTAARTVQEWTSERLTVSERAFLTGLPSILVEPDEFVAVHGCYLNDSHYKGYVTSTMLEANLTRIASRSDWPRLAFCGHTHVPLSGWLRRGVTAEIPGASLVEWPRDAESILVNPGAVGQPRDGDPRAAYSIVDTRARTARVKRVPYDVGRTFEQIRLAGLPSELGDRLREGR